MPTHDFENIGDVLNFELLKGTITAINIDTDMCTVKVAEKPIEAPIFYHCEPNSIARSNGAIEGAAGGFAVNDEVIVLIRSDNQVVKVIGHIDGVRSCGIPIISIMTVSTSGIKIRLALVDKEKIEVRKECVISGLSIAGENVTNTQIIWDYLADCYQLLAGNSIVFDPTTLCRKYAVSIDGAILEDVESKMRYLPNPRHNLEMLGTNYRYAATDAYCLVYGPNWQLLAEFDDITGEPKEVPGSAGNDLGANNVYTYNIEGWPTDIAHLWSKEILGAVINPDLQYTGRPELAPSKMAWIYRAMNAERIIECKIFYEDSATHALEEFMISSAHSNLSNYPIEVGLSKAMLQVKDKLWYFEESESYCSESGSRYFWYLDKIYITSLRIASLTNPLDYRIAHLDVSDFASKVNVTIWGMRDGVKYSEPGDQRGAPTNVILVQNMTYCKAEDVVLITKLRWDNVPGLPSLDVDSPMVYPTAPDGTLTQYIETYNTDGILLYTTVLETFAVPSVWYYTLKEGYMRYSDGYFATAQKMSFAEWGAVRRHISIGSSKTKPKNIIVEEI